MPSSPDRVHTRVPAQPAIPAPNGGWADGDWADGDWAGPARPRPGRATRTAGVALRLPAPGPALTPDGNLARTLAGIRAPRVLCAVFLAVPAALSVLARAVWPIGVQTQVLLGAASVVLLAVVGVRLITGLPGTARGIAHWRIGPWFLLWAAVSFGVASVTWLDQQTGTARLVTLASVVDALDIMAVALVCWTVGYVAGVPGPLREQATRVRDQLLRGTVREFRGAWTPWLLYAAGSAARLSTVLLYGGYGYVGDPATLIDGTPFGNLISLLSTLCVVAVAVAAHRAATWAGGRLTLILLVTTEIVVGALGGGKESFVMALLAVLIPYAAVRGRPSLRLLAAGMLLFVGIVIPFNAAYRAVVRTDAAVLSPAAAIAAAPAVLSETLHNAVPGAPLLRSTQSLLHRIREIDSIAIVAQRTPDQVPYADPLAYLAAPVVGVIPRAIWPDKPVLTTGYQFSQDYFGLPPDSYSSSAITPAGDLYRHGGWPVLVAGMVLFGMGCRLFDTLFAAEADPRAVIFLLAFLPVVVKSEVDMFALLVSLPSGVVAATLGVQLACRRPSPRQPARLRWNPPSRPGPGGTDTVEVA